MINTIEKPLIYKDKVLSVAPMMDWTDRHCRYFLRLFNRHVHLYTEMVTTGALIHGDRQRKEQGAMSFGSDGLLLGSDVADKPFLPGGIWLMRACYVDGTPSNSAYRHWLESLAQAGQFP